MLIPQELQLSQNKVADNTRIQKKNPLKLQF